MFFVSWNYRGADAWVVANSVSDAFIFGYKILCKNEFNSIIKSIASKKWPSADHEG